MLCMFPFIIRNNMDFRELVQIKHILGTLVAYLGRVLSISALVSAAISVAKHFRIYNLRVSICNKTT